MSSWPYLTFGFALLFTLLRPNGGAKEKRRRSTEIGISFLKLSAALVILLSIDHLLRLYLWIPSGRRDLAPISIFLLALLLDWVMNRSRKRRGERGPVRIPVSRFTLALFGFALWTIEQVGLSAGGRALVGISLSFGTALFEWLLEGLRSRMQLTQTPRILEGLPALFWLAMLLCLSFHGVGGLIAPFVNRAG